MTGAILDCTFHQCMAQLVVRQLEDSIVQRLRERAAKAGVSMEERRDLVDRIREHLAENGIAALLVEHDMDVIRNLCTKVYVMDAGKIIAQGPPEEVMRDVNVRRAYLG